MTAGSSLMETPKSKWIPSNAQAVSTESKSSRYEGSNPFQTNDQNKLPMSMRIGIPKPRIIHSSSSSNNAASSTINNHFHTLKFESGTDSAPRPSIDHSIKTRGESTCAFSSKFTPFSPLRKGEEVNFKSALDVMPNTSNSFLFEDKMAILTDNQTTRDGKEWVLQDQKGDSDMLNNRSNSMDEVVSHIFENDGDGDSDSIRRFKLEGIEDITRGVKKKRHFITLIIVSLIVLVLTSGVLAGFPVFTCQSSKGVCLPQLKVQLTDKSPAAKTALVTVKEALKVLSYLALDFGDTNSDLDMINSSLDSYYQDKVIDTFNVDTVYEINALGYCRSSIKADKGYFCMKSYGFDLLSVFVRDAGVQLGELTKTNINIMGDSFATAYELAITGFNHLSNVEGSSQEYINWAILLQKFSKGLGFLAISQFYVDCVLLVESILLLTLINVRIKNLNTKNNIRILKKILVITMTILGFVNLLVGFLICSLTLEYYLKLTELAQSVGIANVQTQSGFVLIWISFVTHGISLCLILFLANSFRKGVY